MMKKITVSLLFFICASMDAMHKENNATPDDSPKKVLLASKFSASKEYRARLTTALKNLMESLENQPNDGCSFIDVREVETVIIEEYEKKNQ